MRSPITPGRNNKLERIFRAASGWARSLLPIPGQQRSVVSNPPGQTAMDSFSIQRNYDLEPPEYIVRTMKNPGGYDQTRQILEIRQYSPEAGAAFDILRESCFSNQTGDDQGFSIGQKLQDGSRVSDRVYSSLLRFIESGLLGRMRREQVFDLVIDRFLAYGDAFVVLKTDKGINRLEDFVILPTWETFRVDDRFGKTSHFEQRRYTAQITPTEYWIHPVVTVHWRYRRELTYGKSMFAEAAASVPGVPSCWENIKSATQDLASASRSVGVNPTLHIMPDCIDETYRDRYKTAYEEKKRQGVVTDFYLMNGADLRKLSNTNPDLKAQVNTLIDHRKTLLQLSQIPLWMFGLHSEGAKDIAGQPALAWSRKVNAVRRVLALGLRQIMDLHLYLEGFNREDMIYPIVFPKFYVDPLERQIDPLEADETNLAGIEDLDRRIIYAANGKRVACRETE